MGQGSNIFSKATKIRLAAVSLPSAPSGNLPGTAVSGTCDDASLIGGGSPAVRKTVTDHLTRCGLRHCPLPLNNIDLGGTTNDNDMSALTLVYMDGDELRSALIPGSP